MMDFKIFVGSSAESRHIVEQLIDNLDGLQVQNLVASVRPWYNLFGLGEVAIESLEAQLTISDLAVFVFAADDVLAMRNSDYFCTRDNVIFEAGMFIGRLTRKRVFLICPQDDNASKYPYKELSDLRGLNVIKAELRKLPGGMGERSINQLKQSVKNAMEQDPRNMEPPEDIGADKPLKPNTPKPRDYSF